MEFWLQRLTIPPSACTSCGRIKPQANIRKPGSAQLRSPHKTTRLPRAALRCSGSFSLTAVATCFQSASGLLAAGSSGRACVGQGPPGSEAAGLERPRSGCSQQWSGQKPGQSLTQKLMHFFLWGRHDGKRPEWAGWWQFCVQQSLAPLIKGKSLRAFGGKSPVLRSCSFCPCFKSMQNL